MARTSDPHAATIKAWETRGRARPGTGSAVGPTQQGSDWSGGRRPASMHSAAVPLTELPDPEFPETKDYARFIAARDSHPLVAFMSDLSESDLADRRVFLSKDGNTGYTLDKNGDFGNLFSLPSAGLGRGSRAILEGVARGAQTLDCYNGVLPTLYMKFGFVPVARTKFVTKYAPKRWDYAQFDNPDPIFMRYAGGDRRTLRERVGTFPKVDLDGVRRVDDYDAGQTAARSAQ